MKGLGVDKLKDLTKLTEERLSGVRNCGKITIEEIKNKLAEYGISLIKQEKLPITQDINN